MNRTELLKRIANKPVTVNIDGVGEFKVRGMTAGDYMFAAAAGQGSDDGELGDQDGFFAAIVCRCTLNEKGKRMFVDSDMDALKSSNSAFILPLALEIQSLSGGLNSESDVKKG